MATTQELIDRTREYLAESDADFYVDADITDALNQGRVELFMGLDAMPKQNTETLVAATSAYDLPADIGTVSEVVLDSNTRRLSYVTPQEAERKDWGAAALPTHYNDDFLSATGLPQLTVYPTPPTGVSDSVSVLYYALPGEIDTSSADPDWHVQFHYSICHLAASILLRADHRQEAADRHLNLFAMDRARYEEWLHSGGPDVRKRYRYMAPRNKGGGEGG